MSGLATVTLDSIAESVDYGVTASAEWDSTGPKFLRITDIQEGRVDWELVPWCTCSERERSSAQLRAGDIVFARTGATTGKSFLIRECPESVVFASYLIRVRLGDAALPSFVSHYFQSQEYWSQISSNVRGVAQPGVNATTLKSLRIPLPPLPEQRRIAAILDQAETLRTQRRAALAQLDGLTQALFLEMFGDPVINPKGWPVMAFESISQDSRIGLVRGSKELSPENPYPYLRMNAIGRDGDLRLAGAHRAQASPEELHTYKLAPGDFLFNTRNSRELVGKTALFRDIGLYLFNNNLLRVRFHQAAHPEYVGALFRTQFIQNELEQRKSGTTNVFAIYYKDLRSVPIPLPPPPLQQTFATRVQAIEALKAQHRAALAELDALFASLQQRAFAGAL